MRNTAGRNWAYTGAVLGGLVSIAANIAHSYVPPAGAPADWSPKVGAVVGAVFWPVFLFVAVEILARVAWPRGRGWQALRFGGIAPVAFVAALVSYRHLSGLLAYYGEEAIVCVLGPFAVDGLMVMATGAILAISHNQDTLKPLPATAVPDPVRVSAPTPPADPALSAATPAGNTNTPTVEPATPPHSTPARPEVPNPKAVAARVTASPTSLPLRSNAAPVSAPHSPKPRPRPTGPATPAQPLAAPAADSSVTAPEPAQLPLPYVVEPGLLDRARQAATRYHTEHGVPITAGQLAARLRVNSEQATQALAVLNLDPTTSDTSSTVNGRRPAGTSIR